MLFPLPLQKIKSIFASPYKNIRVKPCKWLPEPSTKLALSQGHSQFFNVHEKKCEGLVCDSTWPSQPRGQVILNCISKKRELTISAPSSLPSTPLYMYWLVRVYFSKLNNLLKLNPIKAQTITVRPTTPYHIYQGWASTDHTPCMLKLAIANYSVSAVTMSDNNIC